MAIYSSPPPARTFRDDKATLLVCWWCTIFAAVIILFRVSGRYIRTERLFKEDKLAFLCIIPLFIRMALVHLVLLYGTNNAITTGLADAEIHHRAIGSRLVLASRIFYAATLWMLKLTISEFFKRLTFNIWTKSHELMLQGIRVFLVLTFVAVVIADIAECQPITHYWQVVPDPGPKCRQGYAQLLTMGISNVMTDILLVVFPIPIIITSQMKLKRKLQLVSLFAFSLLPAGTTLYRIPNIIERNGSQQYRSLLASVEILFAAAVANALVLGSFVRDRGVKKQRWKVGSISESVERTQSRRGLAVGRHWGSDEDLVRDLGLGVDRSLREDAPQVPRIAPMAVAGNPSVNNNKGGRTSWQYPGERSDTSDELDYKQQAADMLTPRKVSFFDVGGLLEENERSPGRASTIDTDGESSTHGVHPTWSNSNFGGLSPAPPRRENPGRGSSAVLQDIGGLLGPSTSSRSGRSSKPREERGYELQTILQETRHDSSSRNLSRQQTQQTLHSLQDVGGLLR